MIKGNLGKLLFLKGLSFAWFPIPTIMLFYQHHGLSIEQAVFLKAVLSGSIFLWEIPSGYIADRWGRKFCLVSGGMVWVAGWLIYCTQGTMLWFMMAEALTGLSGSLISGADTAITYDTLLQLGRAREYRQFEGKLVAIAGLSEAVCGLIGANLAQNNLVYPFYLQTLCLILYVVLAISLREPQWHQAEIELNQEQSLWSIIIEALVKNRSLRWLILLSANISVATFLIVWLSQSYLSQYEVPMSMFGVVWVGFHLVMSFASLSAPKVEPLLGLKWTLLFLVGLLGGSYILLGMVAQVWGIIFVAVIYFVRGLVNPLLSESINEIVPSSNRATVFSIKSFVFRLSFVIIAPFSGWLADKQSLNLSLAIMGIVFLISGICCWCNLVKLKSV